MTTQATRVVVQVGNNEYRDIQTYSLDSNVLTMVDACSFQLVNPFGARTNEINLGDPVAVYMSDPRVAGNKEIQILKGLVTGVTQDSTDRGGTVINLDVADLGWHLVNNSGPLFKNISRITFAQLLELMVDSSWDFAGIRAGNDTNRRLMQGKALIGTDRKDALTLIPPICFEAGDSLADKLILYATRAKQLVNVSGDGYLQIFSPNYGVSEIDAVTGAGNNLQGINQVAYSFQYHTPTEAARKNNNVRRASVRQTIEGIYTDITCVGTVVNLTGVAYAQNDFHPGTFFGKFHNASALPFKRFLSFSDGDALTNSKKNPMATDHANRKAQRGLFDAFTIEYTVEGHVMGNLFITPDSMAGVNDTINKINGNFYVSARRFQRSLSGGTTTTVTLHRPNLLHGGPS